MTPSKETDTLVVGGGVVGSRLAYGLALAGDRVRVLDEGDVAFRAARGNFGLVWVQGKGRGAGLRALDAGRGRRWPAFAGELADGPGIDVQLSQVGGLNMCLDEDDLARRAAGMQAVREQLGGDYPYDVLDHADGVAVSPYRSRRRRRHILPA